MTQPASLPIPPDLPADGTYIYHSEADALLPHPDLLMAFMGLRLCLLRSDGQPSAEDLARVMKRHPREVAELLHRLERMWVIGREGPSGRYVINPVGLWQLQPARSQAGFVLPRAGAGS